MFEILNENPNLYAGLIECIRRGSAEILEADDDGVFLADRVRGCCMIVCKDLEKAKAWIKAHENRNYELMVVFERELAHYLLKHYQMNEIMDCVQAVYPLQEKLPESVEVIIRPAVPKDVPFICRWYTLLPEEDIRQIIEQGDLFVAEIGNERAGFAGRHLEGGMGLLEVVPEFRRKHVGRALENHVINDCIRKGITPFCQIEASNTASLALQKRTGMQITKEHMYWVF